MITCKASLACGTSVCQVLRAQLPLRDVSARLFHQGPTYLAKRWSAKELGRLMALSKDCKTSWDSWELKQHFPDRSIVAIGKKRYALRGGPKTRRLKPRKSDTSTAWSEDEIKKLRELREEGKMSWLEVARSLNRSIASARAKYVHTYEPGHRRNVTVYHGRWTREEDDTLIKAMAEGRPLDVILQELPGRPKGAIEARERRLRSQNDSDKKTP